MRIQKFTDLNINFELLSEAKKRGSNTNIKVLIDDRQFINKEASVTFTEVIDYISIKVGIDEFLEYTSGISPILVAVSINEFTEKVNKGSVKQNSTGDFLINAHNNTNVKKRYLENLINHFNLNGSVEIIDGKNKFQPSKKSDISIGTLDDSTKQATNVLCVRAGERNKDVDYFISNNFAGISYDLKQDISNLDKNEIEEILISNGSEINQAKQFISQIELFKKIKIGDIILCPTENTIWVGKSKSGVYFVENENYENRINVEWIKEIEKDKSINIPRSVFPVKNFNIESLSFTQNEPDLEVKKFKEFNPTSNPFSQAYCVLGESGAGKSQTISHILEKEGHEFLIIIPTSLSISLLGNYSTAKGKLLPSRLANLILEAYENPSKLYTAVVDECHKPRSIEMVNDELLQAISKYRNNDNRFLTLEGDVYDLMLENLEKSGLKPEDYLFRRNIRIPDNFGFVFLSSKPDVIVKNDDFYNRVDIINLPHYTKTGKVVNKIDDLLTFKVADKSEFSEIVKDDRG